MARGIRVLPDRLRVVIEDDNTVRQLVDGEAVASGSTVFELRPIPLDVKQRFLAAARRQDQDQIDDALIRAADAIIVSAEGLVDAAGRPVSFDPAMVRRGNFSLIDLDLLVGWMLSHERTPEDHDRKNAHSGSTLTPRPSSGHDTTAPGAAMSASASGETPATRTQPGTTAEAAS